MVNILKDAVECIDGRIYGTQADGTHRYVRVAKRDGNMITSALGQTYKVEWADQK